MKVIEFTDGPGSSEWLEWRKKGIAASDIAVIMGKDPYKTPLQLWDEKCGYAKGAELTAPMRHGIAYEETARQWLNNHEGLRLVPICLEDDENPYFRASLDGWDHDHRLLCEIKCPVSEEVLDNARNHAAIPDHWWHQIQWQIMIARPKKALFALWDYRYQYCIVIPMYAHPQLEKSMRQEGAKFWNMVRMGKAPEPTVKDYKEVEDEELKRVLEEYESLKGEEKRLQERLNSTRECITPFYEKYKGNFKAYGFSVRSNTPRISYDIDQMRLDGIDVDLYSKKSSPEGFSIRMPKTKEEV